MVFRILGFKGDKKMKKKILVLGSTGSIGTQTLDVVSKNPELFEIEGIACNDNLELAEKQAKNFGIKMVAIANKGKYNRQKDWFWGDEGILEMIEKSKADLVVMAISGAKSLLPTLKAIEKGKDIALASKEVMVLAGEMINKKVAENKVKLMPVDSEHSAIWQSLRSGKKEEIEKIILTCSGGPFRNLDEKKLEKVTVEQALNHPNWNMGKRITMDCATLMNKGLEFIEARWLFGLRDNQIQVVIHPQSLIHSAIQYQDGSIIAQIGDKDMRVAIQYALTYPDRIKNDLKRIDWWSGLKMEFDKPDLEKFPCLSYAMEASKAGGTMPVVLNAADEVAVSLFLEKKIKFTDIPKIIEKAMSNHKVIKNPNLNQILEVDAWAREEVRNILE
jgi:1-deoxy-D-xylulose-5-phosphate reductoisomerase